MTTRVLGSDPNKPNFVRSEFSTAASSLKLIRDELGGTQAMHAESRSYIKKWKAELKENYDIRRVCESFFEGLGVTLSAAVGMAFAKPPIMTWNNSEAAILPHLDNVDLQGTEFVVFVKQLFEAGVRDGLACILVDHTPPPIDPDTKQPRRPTAEDEQKLNLRPVWAAYDRSQVINWRTAVVGNETKLTLVVLHESSQEPEGLFGSKTVHRFRVLRLTDEGATWEVWRLKKDDANSDDAFEREAWGAFTNKNGEPSPVIPIAVAYAGRKVGPMLADPPLMGVAWANLNHWQIATSLRFNTEVACFAQPTVIGKLANNPTTGEPQKLAIGPLVAVHVQDGGDFKWSEPSGTGLARLEALRDEKLVQMSHLGLNFLTPDKRAAETAEAKRIDSEAENATLASASQGCENAINEALRLHAWYLGIPWESAPTAALSRDFESTVMAADVMVAYVKACKDAGMPPRILLEAWQQGGRIPADVNLDELEAEMEANAIAAAEREAEVARERAENGLPALNEGE